MTPKSLIGLVGAFVLALVAMDSFFIVKETEKAVQKRFAEIVEADLEPGMYFKWPIIDKVVRVDGRTLVHDVPSKPFLTSEKKLLKVDSFVIWRIADVQRYVTTVGSSGSGSPSQIQFYAQQLIDPRVIESLRNEFAERTVNEVVASEREKLMDAVAERVNENTMADLGVEVIDIRVAQVDWPEQVRSQVFRRMRAERNRDAAEHRASGKEAGERIRAEADRKRTILLAEAYRKAQKLRGEGDAKAANTYAGAYKRDPEFFRFYRSLEGYRKSLDDPEDILVLEPTSDFFRYLKDSSVQR